MSAPIPSPLTIPSFRAHRPSEVRHPAPITATSSPRSILVFSGGSAMNTFVSILQGFTDDTAYIMPVSDDGGSTSEIIKVLGGPGIGDLRSRVVRLAETRGLEGRAVHDLLSYRLPFDEVGGGATPKQNGHGNGTLASPKKKLSAKEEWLEMLEGRHHLWDGISHPYRETIRTFLAHFQHELFRSATRKPLFNFQGGSIGNFFLTGSRLFFDNLDAAVFQFMRIMRVPPRTEVVPVLTTTRGAVVIAAAQRDGGVIYGQCEISHPGQVMPEGARTRSGSLSARGGIGTTGRNGPSAAAASPTGITTGITTTQSSLLSTEPTLIPFTSVTRSPSQNLIYSKTTSQSLSSPLRRIYYVNRERQEIFPDINPVAAAQLSRKRTIIYGCGSLYTSILPCLVVPEVGRMLADNTKSGGIASPYPIRDGTPPAARVKLLLLNGSHDRETEGYTALDFVYAITDALNYSCMVEQKRGTAHRPSLPDIDGNSSLPFTRDRDGKPVGLDWWVSATSPTSNGHTNSEDDDEGLTMRTSRLSLTNSQHKAEILTADSGRTYLGSPHPPAAYITHLLYPEDGEVRIDVERVEALGIRCVRVRKAARSVGLGQGRGLYGVEELGEVLDCLVI